MNFHLQSDKQYGIMLSGGLDSAVLLYLILLEKKDIRIQPFTIPKHDGAMLYINNIIKYMNTHYQIQLPDTITVGDKNLPHADQGPNAVREIKQRYSVDHLFFGSNQNPPIDLGGTNPVRIRPPDSSIVCPFFDLFKTDIVNLAVEHNLQDLFNITHSCTELQTTRCNTCWQCKERAWAFTTLNIIDTGTI
jgi:7-cyano-7-deazaguanine synthase in queuosine biosynthesis